MREIKFRAWKKTNTPEMFKNVTSVDFKKNVVGLDYKVSGWTLREDTESLDNVILMQYTGLKDKNGVEIYEGDIDQEDNGEINVIVYLKKAGSYCVMPLDIYLNDDYQEENYFPQLLYNFGYDWAFDNQVPEKYLNIVGNIYENQELLNG